MFGRKKKFLNPMMTDLLDEYAGLLDEEAFHIAKNGKADKALKKKIQDCEKRIDATHKWLYGRMK